MRKLSIVFVGLILVHGSSARYALSADNGPETRSATMAQRGGVKTVTAVGTVEPAEMVDV